MHSNRADKTGPTLQSHESVSRRRFSSRMVKGLLSGLALVFLGRPEAAAAFSRAALQREAFRKAVVNGKMTSFGGDFCVEGSWDVDDHDACEPTDEYCSLSHESDSGPNDGPNCWCLELFGDDRIEWLCCDYLCDGVFEMCCGPNPCFGGHHPYI